MKRLNKKQCAQREELITKLNDAALQFNNARQELEEFREEIHSQLQEYYDDHSDNWREGDVGLDYESFMDSWAEEPADECADFDDELYPTEVAS